MVLLIGLSLGYILFKYIFQQVTGKIMFFSGIVVNMTECIHSGCPYRYQEWTEGIHNYNNSMFLGLDVCLLIRSG